jgi:hypothetical protein
MGSTWSSPPAYLQKQGWPKRKQWNFMFLDVKKTFYVTKKKKK